jgi:phytoene dehydrogenase-like protein
MTKQKILIAGAGLGGLTAALALLRDGHQVQVFEQASQLGEVRWSAAECERDSRAVTPGR